MKSVLKKQLVLDRVLTRFHILFFLYSTREELDLQVGDTVGVAGNHWNGFNKGRNHRAGRIGLYPQYKTRERVKIVDFPTYSHVKL